MNTVYTYIELSSLLDPSIDVLCLQRLKTVGSSSLTRADLIKLSKPELMPFATYLFTYVYQTGILTVLY